MIDGDKNLLNQTLNSVKLTTYSDIVDIKAKYSLLMDLCFTDIHLLEDALSLATVQSDILYEEDCFEIKSIKDKIESNQK